MTKATATIAILLVLTLGASAQSNNGLFGRGPETEENDRNTPNGGLINLPGSHGSTNDADVPLGGGIALLTGLGTAYLVAKKRKNAQRGAMMALLALLAFGPTAWAQNGIYCTASDKNRVVCTDGTIYDNVAAATADGKTAAAMIIYIDESNKAGLALALRDEGQYTQADGITACNNKNTSMPVVGGTWKLASKSEWDKMISAAGSGPALFEGFSSVGGTDMLSSYWSSEMDESGVNGLIIQKNHGWSGFVSNAQTVPVRACLTFNLLTLYEISSQNEWNAFCTVVNLGNNFIDKYVKLTSDISVSEMAGFSENFSFRGLFDGDGHTLTVSYNTEYAVTAPFRYVNNATIRNLKTTGTITTSAMCAAGIVGEVAGSLNLISCSSSVAISSSRGDIDTHGGLVASNGGNVTINGCVFDGSFAATVAHTNSYGTTFCGGIVGMCNENTSATITNSLVAPSSVSEGMINETFVGLYNGATVTIENCYFVATANLPSNQGTQVYYTAPANGIYKSITINGTTVYSDACSVSGVEAAYDLDQGLVFITPTVTDPFAATLTFGTDYTATMDGDAVQSLPVSISTAGNYTLVLTGAGDYTGSTTFNITATGDVVNSALTISSEEEWNTFAASVNNGTNYSGQYVKLTEDISVSTMVGSSETNSFQGTFLGDGVHTLTFTKGAAESAFGEEYCAPFRFVKNATIRDLKVTGDIYTSHKYAAGLVAHNSGTTTITNCQVGTVIHSSVGGNGAHGGIVAMPASNTTTNIEGCVFNGRLLATNITQYCGGFVGWSVNTTTIVTNSLYAPDANIAVAQGETAIDNGATFVRGNNPFITGCCYTETMGNAQGTQVYSITPDTGITIENAGEVSNEYNVSGLTFYTTGLKCGDVHYAASGNNVSLNLSCPTTATVNYQASNGTLSGNGNLYTLTMPAENVVIICNIVREIAGYGDSETNGWAFIASPVAGSIGATTVGNIFSATEYDLYQLNPSNSVWQNWKVGDGNNTAPGFNLVNGQGYLYATKETKTLVFSGTFNTNTTKTLENLPAGYNLVGNPFIVNAYVSKPYYTLNVDGSAILSTPSTEAIAACYGVIVEVEDSESVSFSTEGSLMSGASNNGGLQIALSQANTRSNAVLDNAIVSFNEGSQLGKFYFGTQNANIYIPQDGKEYAIAVVGRDGVHTVSTNEIPVNFKAKQNGTYTLTVNPEGVEMAYLHLIDNMTGADVDLLPLCKGGRGDYTFTAKTTDYASRFRLVFSICGDANGDNDGDNETPFAFISNGNIVITADTQNVTLQIVDAMGRMVVCSDGVHTVSTTGMTAGVYVLRLIDGDNVKTQKIVIQ